MHNVQRAYNLIKEFQFFTEFMEIGYGPIAVNSIAQETHIFVSYFYVVLDHILHVVLVLGQ